MTIVPCHERYLGLPTVTGKDKGALFRGISDRIWKKVNGWEGQLLSKVGKEILIKAVAQAIPNYTIECFPCSFLLVLVMRLIDVGTILVE